MAKKSRFFASHCRFPESTSAILNLKITFHKHTMFTEGHWENSETIIFISCEPILKKNQTTIKKEKTISCFSDRKSITRSQKMIELQLRVFSRFPWVEKSWRIQAFKALTWKKLNGSRLSRPWLEKSWKETSRPWV